MCVPDPFSWKIGFGMKVAVLPATAAVWIAQLERAAEPQLAQQLAAAELRSAGRVAATRQGSSGRKPGAQPGHEGKAPPLLPAWAVDEVVEHWPSECACGRVVAEDERVAVGDLRRAVARTSPTAHLWECATVVRQSSPRTSGF
jgi:hypothetical protein